MTAVITGAGVVSPAGIGRSAHFASLIRGRSKITCVRDRLHADGVRAPIGGAILLESPTGVDRHVALAHLVVGQALSEAGLANGDPVCDVIGATAVGGSIRMEEAYRIGPSGTCPAKAFSFAALTDAVAERFAIGGARRTVSTGCTAGLDALGTAVDRIAAGVSSRVLVVAADAPLTAIVYGAFQRIRAVSVRAQEPERASCPFHRLRDGFVLGEGAAAFVLEEARAARMRGARALATVMGWASVSNAFHMTAMREDGSDIARVMSAALARASVSAGQVDLVDLHATSTKMNDKAESVAVHTVFRDRGATIPVTAQKGVVGHALGASNALEVAGALSMLEMQIAPPTANLDDMDPACPVNAVRERARDMEIRTVLKVSSGFSGIHTAMVLGSAPW